MRAYLFVPAALLVGGCANDAGSAIAYDETARSLGPHLTTDRLADATTVARGGVAPDERDGVLLSYDARCTNGVGKSIPCGEWTVNADVTAFWGNRDLAGLAHWQLRGLDEDLGFVVAQTWATGAVTPLGGDRGNSMELDLDGALAWDTMGLVVRAGSQSGTTTTVDGELTTLIVYDGRGHARLTLDDRAYDVDLATGEVSLPVIVE
jgi:hypothetical protein